MPRITSYNVCYTKLLREPSAILAFRDEYPELVNEELRNAAEELAKNALLFEEFVDAEIEKGNITAEQFTTDSKNILLHGHCQQNRITSYNVCYTKLLREPSDSARD